MKNNEESITITASVHDYEDEAITEEQAAAVEWLKKPEYREHITRMIREAAEAACAAVHGICQVCSAVADLLREACRTKMQETDEEDTKGDVQHDRIE